ncbi:inositol-phosphate phosphatase [Malassezia japonica]|uniref:Inositol-1-monophosphatase n=1 Tax=Malassezia japonica TaxID=223818 RepID=A0AAF0EY82_9BASI|nr:inositol-phosphate phosphatase [Malassezia japonica]WFD37389.1 inositol-phosphate phosphatase [Malassezia japonica]
MPLDLDEVLDFAIALSQRAGQAIVEGSETRFKNATGFDEKKNTADLVTETDQNTEKLVCESIKARFPDHQFIGEESWAAGEQAEVTDAPTWIIDPIDGTTNFVKGFPFVCISIGFVYQSEPVVGVIFAPFMGHLYAARKGSGAFMTSPLHPERRSLPLAQPQPLPSLKQALLAFEWGSDRSKEVMDMKSRTFQRLTGDAAGGVQGGEMALGVRSVGSAALNFAHVASGCLDLYWEIGCWAWDVCAGMVIAREAGCAVVGSKDAAAAAAAQGAWPPAVTPKVLTGRKYLVVRAIGDVPSESGADAQKRTIGAFYGAVEEWDPK